MFIVVAGGLAYTALLVAHRQPLPVIAAIPTFALLERSGKPFTDRDLSGQVWVADFIFTSCAGTCPLMSEDMRRLQSDFMDNPSVNFISFTVDPDNDTLEVLRGYSKGFDAKEGRWFFVTGEKKRLYALAQNGFKLAVFESPSLDGPFTHSDKFALLDRHKRMRGFMDENGQLHAAFSSELSEEMKKLREAVRQLLRE